MKIQPTFERSAKCPNSMKTLISSTEELLAEIIPVEVQSTNGKAFFDKLEAILPIAYTKLRVETGSATASIAIICGANNTQGTGRFLFDICSRMILPGIGLPPSAMRALPFEFTSNPDKKFFVCEVIVLLSDKEDLSLIEKRLEHIKQQIRLTVMMVKHTRQTLKAPLFAHEEKQTALLAHKARQLLKREGDTSLFEEAHKLILSAIAETNRNELTLSLGSYSKEIDTDLFTQIQKFVMHLNTNFIALRDLTYLKRIITHQYLFKDHLMKETQRNPERRSLTLKLYQTSLTLADGKLPVLGIALAINLLSESEKLHAKHIVQAIQTFLPTASKVIGSIIELPDTDAKHKLFYLEVRKKGEAKVTSDEFANLLKKLPREIQSRIETIAHPLITFKNEEEVMRNILTLSNQLKYVHDIPQGIINFFEQRADEIAFTVILVRIQKGEGSSVKKRFLNKSTCRITNYEVKTVGTLRKRYVKEAHVFELRLAKEPFLRKDSSLDLYKARQSVFQELHDCLGEIRDYNGGMISKQNERLIELRSLLHISNDFLLENFFYSLTPPQMQSLLPSPILACLFTLITEAHEHNFKTKPLYFSSTHFEGYSLFLLATIDGECIDFITKIVTELDPSLPEFTTSHVQTYEIHTLGYVMRCSDSRAIALFQDVLEKGIKTWNSSVSYQHTQKTALV